MIKSADKGDFGEALRQFALINRITIALSTAVGTEDLADTLAAVLVSPLGLHFSRAFLFCYDTRRECFLADRAVGISSREQAHRLLEQFEAERRYLDDLVSDPAAVGEDRLPELIDRLQAGALCIEALQEQGAGHLDFEGWATLCVGRSREPTGDLFSRLSVEPSVLLLENPEDVRALPEPLNAVLTPPFAAFSVETSKGLRLAILVDRAHQPDPTIRRNDLSLLEWLRSQLSLAWASAELYADLDLALARQRELDVLKDNFLATISHELRTPLTAVLGFLGLVLGERAGPLTADQTHLLDRSRRQADHLLGLVNDLLILAEYQAGSAQELPLGPVDVQAALRAALLRLRIDPKAEKTPISEPRVGREPFLAVANPTALERILFHLLHNAAKFSPPGAEVAIRFDRVGENVYAAIEDRGPGIERSQMREIFSHFYQVDSRLKRTHPGMGIGLTLVKLLLDATGGHVLVESRPGEGSVFTVVYPAWQKTRHAGLSRK